jgi:hypothetical protein
MVYFYPEHRNFIILWIICYNIYMLLNASPNPTPCSPPSHVYFQYLENNQLLCSWWWMPIHPCLWSANNCPPFVNPPPLSHPTVQITLFTKTTSATSVVFIQNTQFIEYNWLSRVCWDEAKAIKRMKQKIYCVVVNHMVHVTHVPSYWKLSDLGNLMLPDLSNGSDGSILFLFADPKAFLSLWQSEGWYCYIVIRHLNKK